MPTNAWATEARIVALKKLVKRANSALLSRDYLRAQAIWRQIYKLAPTQPVALYNAALMAKKAGLLNAAASLLRRFIAVCGATHPSRRRAKERLMIIMAQLEDRERRKRASNHSPAQAVQHRHRLARAGGASTRKADVRSRSESGDLREAGHGVELGVHFGYQVITPTTGLGNALYDGDVPSSGPTIGVRVGYDISHIFSIEGEIKGVQSAFRSDGTNSNLLGVRGLIVAHVDLMDGLLRPFWTIGIGFDLLRTDHEGVDPSDPDAVVALGLGTKLRMQKGLLLRLDGRVLAAETRNQSMGFGGNYEFIIGLSFQFN